MSAAWLVAQFRAVVTAAEISEAYTGRLQPVRPDTDLNNFLWQQPTNPSTASDLDIFFFHSGTAAEMPDKNIESLLSAALAKVSSTDCQNFCHT